jgi:hypothetical protein
LYHQVPRRPGIAILSGRSKIAASLLAFCSTAGPPNAATVRAFCSSTQAAARAPSISSSQRYGSSSGASSVGLESTDIGNFLLQRLTAETGERRAIFKSS